jgi:Catalase
MNMKPKENVEATEPSIIASIVAGTIADQERDYKPGTLARRDVHSKSHGTFDDATFTILPNILIGCRIGLFAKPGAVYPTTVRLSNGAPGVGPDVLPNVRGIAIKVRTVSGAKLLLGDEAADCCDFLLANHPVSFHRYLDDYPEIRALMAQGKVGEVLKRFKPEGRLLLKAVLKLVKNPLKIAYFSQTPYQFGADRVVKYALVPAQRGFFSRVLTFFSLPNLFDAAYLRHAAEKTLRQRAAKFTLCVQFQGPDDPIEDPSVEWRSPLVPLAELTIPQRQVPLLESAGEQLTFNPWRTLPEHRPLGWVNRVREAVYRADFTWRTKKNAANAAS